MFRIKYSRECAFKLLYQLDALETDKEFVWQLLERNEGFFKNLNQKEKQYITDIIEKVIEKREAIDERIASNLIGWKLKRLMSVDRSLLRTGLGEYYFNKEKAVIIDDIVRIAKKYGGPESYKIINAVLDKALI